MSQNSQNPNHEIIDLDQYAQSGITPPKGKQYRFMVDRQQVISEKETLTGREILQLANKPNPDGFMLRQKLKGGTMVSIKLDQVVDLTEPGIEKFKTLPLDQTEGESLRRDFLLLEEDQEFLEGLDLEWETIDQQGAKWVLVKEYPIIKGYNVDKATVGIRITPGYPTAQLDMLYFFPALSRLDGQPINALSTLVLDGRNFQQWSRHRTSTNPWRPGYDNLSTHLPLADAWLLQEFTKRPYHAISA